MVTALPALQPHDAGANMVRLRTLILVRWMAIAGQIAAILVASQAYALLLRANIVFNAVRRRLNLPYWSLSAYLKRRVKNAVQYVCNY